MYRFNNKYTNYLRLRLYLAVGVWGIFFGILPAHAIQVSPLRQTIVVNPGSTARVFVGVGNNSEQTMIMTPRVEAYAIDPAGKPVFIEDDVATRWVNAANQSYEIATNESVSIPFDITVPSIAEPGGHYLALFITNDADTGPVHVQSRVGSLLMLYVAGEVIERLDITSIQASSLWKREQREVSTTFKNTGTIHVVPTGDIVVHDWRGGLVTSGTINPRQRKILPHTTWTDEPIIMEPRWFQAGPLTITVNVSYGVTGQFVRSQKQVWFIPLREVGVVTVVAAVIVSLFIARNRKIHRADR